MSRIIPVSLFFVLLFASLLGLSLSLAPGLSVKNAYLYVIIVFLIARSTVELKSGGLLDEPIPVISMHAYFNGLIFYALCSWLFMVFVARHIEYDGLRGLINLKVQILDLYLVFIVFFFSIRTKQDVVWAAKAVVLLVVIYNVITILDLFNLIDFGLVGVIGGTKIWGPLGHANQYGAFLAFFLPGMIAIAIGCNGFQRVVYAIGAAVSVVLLIATLARGAYVGLLVGTVIAGYLYRSHLRLSTYLRNAVLVIFFVLLLVIVSGQWESFFDRVVSTTNRAADVNDISSGRLRIWSAALSRQMEMSISLFLGVGWDSYKQSGWFLYSPHNMYLNYYFELGIVGLALYFATLVKALRVVLAGIESANTFDRRFLMAFTIGLCSLLIYLMFAGLGAALLFMWAYIGLMVKLAYLITKSNEEDHGV